MSDKKNDSKKLSCGHTEQEHKFDAHGELLKFNKAIATLTEEEVKVMVSDLINDMNDALKRRDMSLETLRAGFLDFITTPQCNRTHLAKFLLGLSRDDRGMVYAIIDDYLMLTISTMLGFLLQDINRGTLLRVTIKKLIKGE